jgi:hypothetical protein
MIFFPWLCAFNIRWYEGPSDQSIFLDRDPEEELLSDRAMTNFDADHSAHYEGFPSPKPQGGRQ